MPDRPYTLRSCSVSEGYIGNVASRSLLSNDAGVNVEMRTLSTDLASRGVDRLMVEGGGTVHTQFLTEDIVDELQLTVAPVFVGDSDATRFVRDGVFPWNPARRAELVEVQKLDDVVLLRYALSGRFEETERGNGC
jgi:5-amino-6-(5-phosphoribosylamino)uracil reductase